MNPFVRIARTVRRVPVIRRAEGFWNHLRPIYHRVLRLTKQRVSVRLGGLPIPIPAEFSGFGWEGYEEIALTHYAEWVRTHPGATVLDVGSSIGVLGLIGLHASDSVRIWAFDADLASLAVIEQFCRYAPKPDRIRRIHGLLSSKPGDDRADPAGVEERTMAEITRLGGQARWQSTRYVCLDGTNEYKIPVYSLDHLFSTPPAPPTFLKIDVEGAELLVLRGAEQFVRRCTPTMLLSVHPEMTRQHDYTAADVREWLLNRGYSVRVLSVDHEEHWWCEPTESCVEV